MTPPPPSHQAPDCAPPKKMPSGLNGFQRAMVHQYCEELGVREETRGIEPNRAIWLIKIGEGVNESAAEKFKRELSEIVKEKNTAPEQEDEVRTAKRNPPAPTRGLLEEHGAFQVRTAKRKPK